MADSDAAGGQQSRVPRRAWRGASSLLAVAGVIGVTLLALLLRLPGLDGAPPGFAIDEARAARYARSIGLDGGPFPLLPDGVSPGAREPLFAWWLKGVGSLAGWGVDGARAASALAGAVLALCLALWLRRALGAPWALAGGLLAATSFWLLTLSRQVSAGMLGAALLALGVLLLWSAVADDGTAAPRWPWFVAAGVAFALAPYAFAPLAGFLPVAVLSGAVLVWRSRARWTSAAPGLVALLLTLAPLAISALIDPDEAGARVESGLINPPRDGASLAPADIAQGLWTTFDTLLWSGPDDARLGLAGRALLDPVLATLTLAGLAVALRSPGRPAHAFALAWLGGAALVVAMLAPGHAELLLAAAPALVLFPVLALRAARGLLARRGGSVSALAAVVAAALLVASAGWSLWDHFERWTDDPATWDAFDGDTRAAVAALLRLPDPGEAAYVSTPDGRPVVEYLAAGRAVWLVESPDTLAIPTSTGRYLVFTAEDEPHPILLRYVTGRGEDVEETPVETGTDPRGEVAWQVWHVGQGARDRLPYTVPAVRFPNRVQLLGFTVSPDLGDVATTGTLPDPPRLNLVLVWGVPRDAPSLTVDALLMPAALPGAPTPDAASQQTQALLAPSRSLGTTEASGPPAREIVIQRVSVVVPQTDDMVVDVLVTLRDGRGVALPPYGPGQLVLGDYAFLNRVQYLPGRP